jgi:5-methylcytosine-specific restriction endonuclease McrA
VSRLQHKRGRKSNYSKSLNNPNHKEVRRRALLREGFKCKVCPAKIRLELHHIDYNFLGKELDNMNWVVILCDKHHQEAHNDINHIWNPKNFNKKKQNYV